MDVLKPGVPHQLHERVGIQRGDVCRVNPSQHTIEGRHGPVVAIDVASAKRCGRSVYISFVGMLAVMAGTKVVFASGTSATGCDSTRGTVRLILSLNVPVHTLTS